MSIDLGEIRGDKLIFESRKVKFLISSNYVFHKLKKISSFLQMDSFLLSFLSKRSLDIQACEACTEITPTCKWYSVVQTDRERIKIEEKERRGRKFKKLILKNIEI